VDQHREIINKSCALSAKDDELETMKRYVFNAAHQQGMNQGTVVSASRWCQELLVRHRCSKT